MLELRELESFPAGNPFHYDAVSVGASLDSIGLPSVYIMDGGIWASGLYIVNSETGQRVRIAGVDSQSQ